MWLVDDDGGKGGVRWRKHGPWFSLVGKDGDGEVGIDGSFEVDSK